MRLSRACYLKYFRGLPCYPLVVSGISVAMMLALWKCLLRPFTHMSLYLAKIAQDSSFNIPNSWHLTLPKWLYNGTSCDFDGGPFPGWYSIHFLFYYTVTYLIVRTSSGKWLPCWNGLLHLSAHLRSESMALFVAFSKCLLGSIIVDRLYSLSYCRWKLHQMRRLRAVWPCRAVINFLGSTANGVPLPR